MGMVSEEKLVETFSKLRPACVRITEEQTVENMKALHKALDESDPSAVNELQEYVLFPLRVLLKQPRESKLEDVYLETVSCISKVIDCADQLSEFSLFLDLFSSLCCLVSTRDANICIAPLCEELKLAAVKCLAKLIKKLPVNFLVRVYTPSFLPFLGHAVTVLLFLAQHESLRTLRCEAMTCLLNLMLVNRDTPKGLKVTCGDSFASFLPGIATGLYKLITGDMKQGHRVTCAAITGLTSAVVLVLSDDYLGDSVPDSMEHSSITDDCQNLSVKRSSDWIRSTSEKLKVVITRIAAVAYHPHWRVRLAMIRFADGLLTHCSNSLSCVVIQLLDILVQGSLDEFPEVSVPGSAALAAFQERQVERGNQPVVEVLEENLFNLATQLPRKIMDPSDANKLNALKLFSSYLALLGTRIDAVLSSNVHFKRLSLALMQILEFETASLLIVEEQDSEISLSCDGSSPSCPYQFKNFAALEVKEEIVKICRILGEQGNFLILVDHFMDLFRQSGHYRKQATFCISEILMGAKTRLHQSYSESEVEMLIRSVLDELLQPEVWNLPLANTSKVKHGVLDSRLVRRLESPGHVYSFNELNNTVLQTCLLIDCVGRCASASGSRFDVHLIEALYPILEKAGSDNVHVSQRAVACALQVAEACTCGNIAGLIRSGMDYLLNSVVLRWRHLRSNPQVLDVLRVMFEFSDAAVLPLLSNTIHQMCDVLDLHYEEFGAQFLKVFRAMVCSILKWYGPPSLPNQDLPPDVSGRSLESRQRNRPKTADDVFSFFEDYRRQKQVLEDMDKNYEQSETQESDKIDLEGENYGSSDSNDAKTEELPFHVELLKLVLERCRHFLIRPESQIRLLVLEIVGQSCLVLMSHQDVLLPLIHKLWTPFVQRFSDSDQIVMMKAFDTLRLMSYAAQDFLRRRVISDILPRVVSVLGKMSDASMKAGPAYKYSMPCKLQLCILNHLGYFCHYADVKGQHLTLLLHTCLPYLSARQPLCLQQACVDTFKRFVEIDPDGVWLLLNDVWCPSAFEPPSDSFPLIKMAGTSERNEYTDNVSELMQLV